MLMRGRVLIKARSWFENFLKKKQVGVWLFGTKDYFKGNHSAGKEANIFCCASKEVVDIDFITIDSYSDRYTVL